LKKKVSVLIGHVFGGSAENANIPLSCAWIAVSAIGFSSFPVFLCLECFYFGFRSKFGEFFLPFSFPLALRYPLARSSRTDEQSI